MGISRRVGSIALCLFRLGEMVSLGEIFGEQFLEGFLQTVEGTTMKLVIPSAFAVSVMVTSVFGKSESAHVV